MYVNIVDLCINPSMQEFMPNWIVKVHGDRSNRFRRNVVHVSLTMLLLISAVVTSELVNTLGLLLAIIGAIAGVGIGLILPPLCYLQLTKTSWTTPNNRPVLAVLITGVLSMVGCLMSVIVQTTTTTTTTSTTTTTTTPWCKFFELTL